VHGPGRDSFFFSVKVEPNLGVEEGSCCFTFRSQAGNSKAGIMLIASVWELRPPRIFLVAGSRTKYNPQISLLRGYARSIPAKASDYVPVKYSSPLIEELVTIRDVIFKLNKSNRGVIKRSILETDGKSLEALLLL
jgi:hypothetical protein